MYLQLIFFLLDIICKNRSWSIMRGCGFQIRSNPCLSCSPRPWALMNFLEQIWDLIYLAHLPLENFCVFAALSPGADRYNSLQERLKWYLLPGDLNVMSLRTYICFSLSNSLVLTCVLFFCVLQLYVSLVFPVILTPCICVCTHKTQSRLGE